MSVPLPTPVATAPRAPTLPEATRVHARQPGVAKTAIKVHLYESCTECTIHLSRNKMLFTDALSRQFKL